MRRPPEGQVHADHIGQSYGRGTTTPSWREVFKVFKEFASGIYKKRWKGGDAQGWREQPEKFKNIYIFKARPKGRVDGAQWLRM